MNKYRQTGIANKVEIELKQAQTVKAELEEMNYEKDDGDVKVQHDSSSFIRLPRWLS